MGLLLCVILTLFLPSCAAEPSDQIEPATFEIEPQYIYASDFSHGIAVVEDADGNFSFIDRCSKNVFGKTFFSAEIVNDNRTMFDTFFPSVKERENSEAYRIRADGSPIPPPSPEAFVNSGPFGLLPAYNGYRCASDANGNMGLLNQEQQWVIEPKYGQVYQTSGGQIRIVDGNDVGFFDKDEEKVVFVEDAVDIDDFEEGLASVALISKDPSRVEGPLYNFIDEEGNCLLQQSLSGTKPQLSEGIITFAFRRNIEPCRQDKVAAGWPSGLSMRVITTCSYKHWRRCPSLRRCFQTPFSGRVVSGGSCTITPLPSRPGQLAPPAHQGPLVLFSAPEGYSMLLLSTSPQRRRSHAFPFLRQMVGSNHHLLDKWTESTLQPPVPAQ
ncbi:hypothetical protein KFE19_08670 [Dysosmobacter sp. Marseille-Q4140]|nr:hypothetical protein KFE19_08670 [Dysosmobacter sp. Marseille-Q4140]